MGALPQSPSRFSFGVLAEKPGRMPRGKTCNGQGAKTLLLCGGTLKNLPVCCQVLVGFAGCVKAGNVPRCSYFHKINPFAYSTLASSSPWTAGSACRGCSCLRMHAVPSTEGFLSLQKLLDPSTQKGCFLVALLLFAAPSCTDTISQLGSWVFFHL